MPKRVIVDLDVMRKNPDEEFRCVYLYHPQNEGVATLRELAAFEMFCRKCELACCVESCPRAALEKDESGVVRRANLRCVGCMSCSRACPFGTILEEALRFHAGGCDMCESLGEGTTPGCVEACTSGALAYSDVAEDEEDIVLVGERMAVKGARWLKIEPPPKAAGAKK
ncbi:MAG: 4Fe-4S dicluster domain-containing protein [Planctomycetota bacterium]|jgi:Fe-S-cluster-containing dehydrogenase component